MDDRRADDRAAELIRAAAVPAPAGLRARVERLRESAGPVARRRRRLAVAGATATAGAAALALALTLPGDVPGGPTIVQAAALSGRPATEPAPPPWPGDPDRLSAAVEGVAFPDWRAIRWPATGARTDTLGDRRVTTVFYARAGVVVGYQIVAGEPLPPPVATELEVVGETVYRTFRAGGRTIVTWVQGDHTCVISGRGVPARVLRRLAAWEAEGAASYPGGGSSARTTWALAR
jgi:hypothetical protein